MNYDDDEFEGPEEDDITTSDHSRFYQNGRLVIRLDRDVSETSMWRHIENYMKKSKFYPNVWFISDHGNAHLMVKPKRTRRHRRG